MFLDCGNIDRNPADVLQRDGRAHPQHRPPPRQHALRHRQPRRARGVVHGRDRVGPDARRSASSRRCRSPRRSTSAWSPTPAVHVREHRPARARDGGRADRRRASTSHDDLPPPLRGHPVRASSSCWRAALAHVERYDGGRAHAHAPDARGLRARPAPRRATPRASSTTCARSRAPRSPALVRELLGDGPRGQRKVSLRATDDRVDVSRDRPRAGRRRPPPGRRLLDRAARPDELVDVPARARSRAQL